MTDQDLKLGALPSNPYRPGAGHMPPYLAGREAESTEFRRLLDQAPILENLVLTGLRGVGKTVLLESFKPIATEKGWLWVGADLSESASVSEQSLCVRLLTDLSVATSQFEVSTGTRQKFGFSNELPNYEKVNLTFPTLYSVFESTPGLASDKLRAVLEVVWETLKEVGQPRILFAYDEAQNLYDNHNKSEYPLSLLLDTFSSIQRRGAPFLLVLTGLPTLFPKLVESRTYAERMFRVVTLTRLSRDESREAIGKPMQDRPSVGFFSPDSIETICDQSAGYPYFIQFICKEVYDVFLFKYDTGDALKVPVEAIQRKLDTDFFAGRWAKATDRQRELLWLIASLERPDDEFTIQELVVRSKSELVRSFSASHTNQMLGSLANQGLVYKNRFGKYSFAVPLFGEFILRTWSPPQRSRTHT